MHHEADPPPGEDARVEEIPYDAVHDLRVAWHREDFPEHDVAAAGEHPDFFAQAREMAFRRAARVLAVLDGGVPVGFALLEHEGDSAEIAQVYVHPGHRGRGIGTALTRAAIGAAVGVRDLWIVADDEGRPKELYSRLGFRPAWTAVEALRLP